MQQFNQAGDQVPRWFDDGGFRPYARSAGRNDEPIARQLAEARSLARRGEFQSARELCADVVLEHQLRLHDDRELLCRAVATLIHARAFQLLSRLLAAVDGRRVRISLVPAVPGAPPHPIRRVETGAMVEFTIDESLFRSASCDAVIDRWSEELARPRGKVLEPVAA